MSRWSKVYRGSGEMLFDPVLHSCLTSYLFMVFCFHLFCSFFLILPLKTLAIHIYLSVFQFFSPSSLRYQLFSWTVHLDIRQGNAALSSKYKDSDAFY